jgi:hypothetical protein
MKTKFTLRRSEIKVRRWLPSAVVTQRPHRNHKAYNRRGERAAIRDGAI